MNRRQFLRIAGSSAVAGIASFTAAQDGPPPARPRVADPIAPNYLLPNSSVLAAAADIDNVPADERTSTHYLSLYNIPAVDRPKLIETLNYAINSVSRARIIKRVTIVPGSENSVVRYNRQDYQFYDELKKKTFGWRKEICDKFADYDAYFHGNYTKTVVRVTERLENRKKFVIAGYYSDGTPYYRTEYVPTIVQEASPTDHRVRMGCNWVNTTALGKLHALTQSQAPIMRADQFLSLITLPPFYHDLLDMGKTVKEFFDMVFADEKQIERAKLEMKGVVVKSGAGIPGLTPVSRHNRTITRYQSLLGYVWFTHDTDTDVNSTEQIKKGNDRLGDYLRILANEQFKATEIIATARNGLQVYGLFQGNAAEKPNERQDEAPINIVVDNTNADRRVRNGRSCMTCHTDGLRPFLPLPQEMVKEQIDVVTPDPKRRKYLQETFISNVGDFLAADQRVFERAVREATKSDLHPAGLTVEENAIQYSRFYNRYTEDDITPQIAAYETGIPVPALLPVIAGAKNDPYLQGLSKNKPFYSVKRAHWEQSFQQAMLLVMDASTKR